MKGKKFNASEKHFHKKELKLTRQIKNLEVENNQLRTDNINITGENQDLLREIKLLKIENEKLIEYSNLSKSDLSDALEKDKSLKVISSFINLTKGGF